MPGYERTNKKRDFSETRPFSIKPRFFHMFTHNEEALKVKNKRVKECLSFTLPAKFYLVTAGPLHKK